MDKTSIIIGLVLLGVFVVPFVVVSLHRKKNNSNE